MARRIKELEVWINSKNKDLWLILEVNAWDNVRIRSIGPKFETRVLSYTNFLKKYKTNSVTRVLYSNNSNI